MAGSNSKLKAAVEDYLGDLRKIKASGAGTAESSYYTPLNNLLNAVGGSLKPKVFCIGQLVQQGAGPPRLRPLRRQAGVEGPAQAGATPRGRRGRGQIRQRRCLAHRR